MARQGREGAGQMPHDGGGQGGFGVVFLKDKKLLEKKERIIMLGFPYRVSNLGHFHCKKITSI